jgi:hypothetical protein
LVDVPMDTKSARSRCRHWFGVEVRSDLGDGAFSYLDRMFHTRRRANPGDQSTSHQKATEQSACALFGNRSCWGLIFLFGGESNVTSALGRKSNLSGRTDIWAASIAAAGNPIIGTGFESFWNVNVDKVARAACSAIGRFIISSQRTTDTYRFTWIWGE